jgi:hypothetical protein
MVDERFLELIHNFDFVKVRKFIASQGIEWDGIDSGSKVPTVNDLIECVMDMYGEIERGVKSILARNFELSIHEFPDGVHYELNYLLESSYV